MEYSFSGVPRRRVRQEFKLPSLTKQSMKDECDVNMILAKWRKTGLVTHVSPTPPKFGDFAHGLDYQASLNQVIAADDAFSALPAAIRDRFANDPSRLIAFLQDPANKTEAIALGLIDAPPAAPAAPAAPPAGGQGGSVTTT